MRNGVRLGVDVGTVRVGISRSDPAGILATPVETIRRQRDSNPDVRRILEIADELDAIEIVVGLPLGLSGQHTASTADAVGFADALTRAVAVPVRLVDERLSTVSAQAALHASGKGTKKSRPVIDQVAATIILQQALDMERDSGQRPGSVVESNEGTES